MDRAQGGGPQALGVLQRRDGGQVVVVDQEQDDPAGVVRRLELDAPVTGLGQDGGLGPVFAVEPDEHEHQDREDDHDQPGALGELHHREQHHDKRRVDPARGVDHEPPPPAGFPGPAVVPGHAEAGHGESGEHPDRVERDERVDGGARHQHQRQGQRGQQDDPVGEHQPVPAPGQPAGQEGVVGDEAGQVREPGEAGVAAGEQDGGGRGLQRVERDLPGGGVAEDEPGFLGEHGGEPGGVRDRVGGVREPGDARDQEGHDGALGGEDLPRVPSFRRAQRADRVGHGLDPGQR